MQNDVLHNPFLSIRRRWKNRTNILQWSTWGIHLICKWFQLILWCSGVHVSLFTFFIQNVNYRKGILPAATKCMLTCKPFLMLAVGLTCTARDKCLSQVQKLRYTQQSSNPGSYQSSPGCHLPPLVQLSRKVACSRLCH